MPHLASAISLVAALALVSCSQAAQDEKHEKGTSVSTMTRITIEDPWIQLPVVTGRPGAAYFTFQVEGAPDKLLSVTTPVAERTAMHETRVEGGVTRMGPVEDLGVQEGEPVGFAPGQKHVMLFGLDPAVKAGASAPLTFTFARTAPVTVEAQVRAFGEGHGAH